MRRSCSLLALLVFVLWMTPCLVNGQVVAEHSSRDGSFSIVNDTESSYQVFMDNSGNRLRIDNSVPFRSYLVQVISPDGMMRLNTWVWKPENSVLVDVRSLAPGIYHMRILSSQDIQFTKLTKF